MTLFNGIFNFSFFLHNIRFSLGFLFLQLWTKCDSANKCYSKEEYSIQDRKLHPRAANSRRILVAASAVSFNGG